MIPPQVYLFYFYHFLFISSFPHLLFFFSFYPPPFLQVHKKNQALPAIPKHKFSSWYIHSNVFRKEGIILLRL